ncbi:MAG: hypothetical protein MUF46_09150 [Desulfobacterales bacterium]|jgi:hypothetical protein|nr:hypothetical protein [Desulfobacterales bacterium]
MHATLSGRNVFQRLRPAGGGDLKLSSTALDILLELDGKSDLDQIAVRSGQPMTEVRSAVTLLLTQGLIEAVEACEPVVPRAALQRIRAAVINAIGPVGEFMLEEKAEEMGQAIESFPLLMLPELIENIALEIRRPAASLAFKQQMIELIKALNRK